MPSLGPLSTENINLHLAARCVEAGMDNEGIIRMFKALAIMGKNIRVK